MPRSQQGLKPNSARIIWAMPPKEPTEFDCRLQRPAYTRERSEDVGFRLKAELQGYAKLAGRTDLPTARRLIEQAIKR